MNGHLSRRGLLAAFGASLVAQRLSAADAAAPVAPPPGKVVLSLAFLTNNPTNKNMKFSADAFRDKYIPALKGAYGDALSRVELRMPPRAERSTGGIGAKPGAGPPPVVAAIISMWIGDMGAFAAATQKSGVNIAAELLKVTNGQPHVQYEEVIGEHGKPRDSVVLGTSGQVTLYPWSEGATWDADYYLKTFLPKYAEAFGEDALKRVEVRRGIGQQGGGKPLFINTVHVYAESAQKFQTAMFRGGMEVMGDLMKVTTIPPMFAGVNVMGVG